MQKIPIQLVISILTEPIILHNLVRSHTIDFRQCPLKGIPVAFSFNFCFIIIVYYKNLNSLVNNFNGSGSISLSINGDLNVPVLISFHLRSQSDLPPETNL